jgi:hypothetical protein
MTTRGTETSCSLTALALRKVYGARVIIIITPNVMVNPNGGLLRSSHNFSDVKTRSLKLARPRPLCLAFLVDKNMNAVRLFYRTTSISFIITIDPRSRVCTMAKPLLRLSFTHQASQCRFSPKTPLRTRHCTICKSDVQNGMCALK